MHAFLAATIALAGSAAAATSSQFKLTVSGNKNLTAWALVNAHVAAGQNVIEIQRPSAYTSDVSYLNGTATQIKNGKAQLIYPMNGVKYPYALLLPQQAVGQIGEVYTEPNGGNFSFSLDKQNRLSVSGAGVDVFYACPRDIPADGKVFTLWYGTNVKPQNLPGSCQPIELSATYQK